MTLYGFLFCLHGRRKVQNPFIQPLSQLVLFAGPTRNAELQSSVYLCQVYNQYCQREVKVNVEPPRHPLERFLSSYRDKIELNNATYFHSLFGEPDYQVSHSLDRRTKIVSLIPYSSSTFPSLCPRCSTPRLSLGIGTGRPSTVSAPLAPTTTSSARWRRSPRTPSTSSPAPAWPTSWTRCRWRTRRAAVQSSNSISPTIGSCQDINWIGWLMFTGDPEIFVTLIFVTRLAKMIFREDFRLYGYDPQAFQWIADQNDKDSQESDIDIFWDSLSKSLFCLKICCSPTLKLFWWMKLFWKIKLFCWMKVFWWMKLYFFTGNQGDHQFIISR